MFLLFVAFAGLAFRAAPSTADAQTYGNPGYMTVSHKKAQRYWMPAPAGSYYSRDYYSRYTQPRYRKPAYRQPLQAEPRYRAAPSAPRIEASRPKKTSPRAVRTQKKTPKKTRAPVTAWKTEGLPQGPVQLVISLPDQRMTVYQGGAPVVTAPVSSGKPGYDTPAGVFSILEKRRVHFSRKYDDAPMPHMQRLTWSGIALHGGRLPGYAASHGCVRLPYDFARELFAFTARGAQVIVANQSAAPVEITHSSLFQPTTLAEILGRKPGSGMQSDASPMPTLPVTETQVASLVTPAAASEVAAVSPDETVAEESRSPVEMLGDLEWAIGRQAAYRERSAAPLRIAITRWTTRERVAAIQRLLGELGYDAGPADGHAGSRTIGAIKAYERASNLPATGMVTDALVTSLAYASGRPPVDNGHLYVRQNGKPLFDAAVAIRDDGRPMGTHLFTALEFEPEAGAAKWTAMTLSAAENTETGEPVLSAQDALDRVAMAGHVRTRLSDLLTPGSTMIVTDSGISNETLRGTDLIVEVD
jgi:lipoprotein-anchoring transpeptidase ErfK/SrfK